MQLAPIPADEAERLADLRALEILDTPPEERFDRVVDLAVRVFDVPIAYIAMIDADRQWFKAKCGLSTDETGRDVSFCGHAIVESEPLIVPDATQDRRFFDNPLVTGDPFVRFYAGRPLHGPGGHRVGTLCIVDRKPRQLTDAQIEVLHGLAKVAEQQLGMVDLISTQRELLQVKAQLSEDLAAAGEYVRSLLPEPLTEGAVRADWRFIASDEIGGDSLGYHWLDGNRFAAYVLDVSGHGVPASLLSCAAHSALRRQTLPDTDFGDPGLVLAALNRAFPTVEHHHKFFTVWYGVYDRRDRTLRYGAAGHPPPLLFPGGEMLEGSGVVTGVLPDADYAVYERVLEPGSRLYVFTDGAYEIPDDAGELLAIEGLARLLARAHGLDATVDALRRRRGGALEDDLSVLEITFP